MAEEKQKGNEKRIAVAKIYVKDFSFESPQAPKIFKSDKWSPQTNLNLRSTHTRVDGDLHEVVLTITVNAKDGDKTIFLVEIQQAGLFELSGYDDAERAAITGSYCPGILFPYAREAVASTIQRGGFPEFVLQPINFDALYMQSQKQGAVTLASTEEKH
ncbi:MAG: protein-export chaperone SecB [Proteobacteria bacterium]|nr:protein-export chaperone SecB [Pseudomonadota bacterium]MDA1062775.1 protein-export chaperone SecB [Pseudomonadota bacterium]